jgi:hypothetical protein
MSVALTKSRLQRQSIINFMATVVVLKHKPECSDAFSNFTAQNTLLACLELLTQLGTLLLP